MQVERRAGEAGDGRQRGGQVERRRSRVLGAVPLSPVSFPRRPGGRTSQPRGVAVSRGPQDAVLDGAAGRAGLEAVLSPVTAAT